MSEPDIVADFEDKIARLSVALGASEERRCRMADTAVAEVRRLGAIIEELVAALEEYVRDFGDNEDGDSQRMADKARAAIAKAKG
jgi:hypothetical protein